MRRMVNQPLPGTVLYPVAFVVHGRFGTEVDVIRAVGVLFHARALATEAGKALVGLQLRARAIGVPSSPRILEILLLQGQHPIQQPESFHPWGPRRDRLRSEAPR
jgi:hypothetical protein